MPRSADLTPAALRLRPGVVVTRRDNDHLQVGLDEPLRVILPASPDVRLLLAALESGAALPRTPESLRALAKLEDAGLIVDGGAPDWLLARHGRDARRRAGARRATRVGLSGPAELQGPVRRLIEASGLSLAGDLSSVDVMLLLATSALRRSRADEQLRDGRPHLPVVATGGGWTLGPFVVPGRTACVRCVDAALGERDPRRALVVEQLADGEVPPDVVMQDIALASAIKEIAAWADGDEPATWNATVALGEAVMPERQTWRRHPHCGCAWDLLAAPA